MAGLLGLGPGAVGPAVPGLEGPEPPGGRPVLVGGGCTETGGGVGGVCGCTTPIAEKSGEIDPYDLGMPEVFVLVTFS